MLYPNDVAIIILNYNNADDTIECIKSLLYLNNKPGAIVIVDNNSKDNSVNKINSFLKEIREDKNIIKDYSNNFNKNNIYFILSDSNDGYSRGNNLGIKFIKKYKHFKLYWILNNDTIVEKNALDALCTRMNIEAKPSIIGSTIVNFKNMSTLQCASGYNSRLKVVFDKPLLSGMKVSNLFTIDTKQVEQKISYIIGASFFIHADIFKKIGYFREDFFLYAEEMEYCIRAYKQGIPLLWAKESIVYHKEGGSTQASSSQYNFPKWVDYLMIRNRTRTIAEHYTYLLPFYWVCTIGIIIKRLLLKKPIRILLFYKAILNGTIGKMGKPQKNL